MEKATEKEEATTQPLVYLANLGAHDYSSVHAWTPLGEYGVRIVTTGDVDRKNPKRLVANVVASLQHFREEDYFVFSGSPLPFALGLAYLMRKLGRVQVLYYMNNKNEYFCIEYTGDMFDESARLSKNYTPAAQHYGWGENN